MQQFTFSPLGDGALTISFGNVIDEKNNQQVLQVFQALKKSSLPLLDVVPAYSSLTVYYNVFDFRTKNKTAYEQVKEAILPFLDEQRHQELIESRQVKIPVCYSTSFGPDLKHLAQEKKLSVDEVIFLHTAKVYRVYMIGFLPGFPYMGKVDAQLIMPRKSTPRTNVAAGSVGIAGEQTGIYPFSSPGGWNIIGRTPVSLFIKESDNPTLLYPGDLVSFYPITEDEFYHYQKGVT